MTDDAERRVAAERRTERSACGAPAERSSSTLLSGASAEQRTKRSGARREASDVAKRRME